MSSKNFKKQIIKLLTFFIVPSALRRQAKRYLKFWFGLSPMKPETFLERYTYNKSQQDFIKKHIHDDIFSYRLVSLGCDCFSRTIPTLWGIKPRKKQGELGYPFDLSRHNIKSVVTALTHDFREYFDNLVFDQNLDSWVSDRGNIVYCHEPDCHENDKDKIISRFSERIHNLRMILTEDTKPAIFICRYAPELAPNGIDEVYDLYNLLYKTLEHYRQNRTFKLLLVDTFGRLDQKRLNPKINFLSCPWLKQPYVWHYDECRYSSQGLKFETLFINTILDLIKQSMC